jgi:hypothetical protein
MTVHELSQRWKAFVGSSSYISPAISPTVSISTAKKRAHKVRDVAKWLRTG